MISRIRRVRSAALPPGGKKVSSEAHAKMIEDLQSIAQHMAEKAILDKHIAEKQETLFAAMKKHKMLTLSCPEADAEIARSSGKSQNIVDPKGLRKLLKDDAEYFACISVSVTKVKDFVSGKELDRITTTIPAVAGEEKLKVIPRKAK